MFLFRNSSRNSFIISFTISAAIYLYYYWNCVSKAEGHYVYLIDDAYIHLSMAKNFALYHVWGVTRHQFSSTSSSPLFTYLISLLIKIFGNNDQLPLYFNVVFGTGIVFLLNQHFSGMFKNLKAGILATLFTIFLAVLHLQVLAGMEHIFHVFLFALSIICFYRWDKDKYARGGFYLTLLLMGLVRFESIFYFAILAFVFLLVKKWKRAIGVLLVGFVPILIFCYFNYQQDGYFFPNSVVVKGTKLSWDEDLIFQLKTIFLDNFLLNVSFYKIGFFPIILCFIFIYRDFQKKGFSGTIRDDFFLIVLSLLMICHSMFADLKGAFRYEAYILVGFSMVLIPRVKGFLDDFKVYIQKERLVSILIIINIFLMVYKTWMAHVMLEYGGKNIYEQQIQSAKFLNQYYNTSRVVANDIGAITYFTEIHLLDIAGLGSPEMIPFSENKRGMDDRFESFLTRYSSDHNYELAIIYDEWFQGHVPKTWKKAAVLKIGHAITVGRDHVSIYSVNGSNLEALKRNIRNFGWNRHVKVTIVEQ